ncbi:MAG: RDD family protein [Bacteroidia bacterium]
MEQILDRTDETLSGEQVEYAGFWIRVVAYIIDAIILGIVNVSLTWGMTGTFYSTEMNIGLSSVTFLINLVYFAAMESSSYQGTLGKIAINAKVVDEAGQRISFANALGRYLSKIISAIILLIGFMMVGWDDRKQGLHDKIASTFVIYK